MPDKPMPKNPYKDDNPLILRPPTVVWNLTADAHKEWMIGELEELGKSVSDIKFYDGEEDINITLEKIEFLITKLKEQP